MFIYVLRKDLSSPNTGGTYKITPLQPRLVRVSLVKAPRLRALKVSGSPESDSHF